jgi:HNH endonuclease
MGYNGKTSTEIERFFERTTKTDRCWLWNGYVMNAGYGAFSTRKGTELVHRWSYEYHIQPIPSKMTIDHLCRNKICVNPDHMEVVTRTENIRRCGLTGVALKESKKTHCPQGHSYAEYGVRTPNGYTKFGTKKYARRCNKCRLDK